MRNYKILVLSLLSGGLFTIFTIFFITASSQHYRLANLTGPVGKAQLALIDAARQYRIKPTLLLAISKIETAGTFSTSIRPKRKNGKFIGTARGLCQFIKVIAKAYELDWSTNDADKQAVACARLLKDNENVLATRLNRRPSNGEIYLSHVFGAGKAVRIIQAHEDLSVAETVGHRALKANRFLAKYKNAAGIRSWAERKITKAEISFML